MIDHGLKLCPDSVKLLYKKSLYHHKRKEHDLAHETLLKLRSRDPSQKDVEKLLKKTEKALAKFEKREKRKMGFIVKNLVKEREREEKLKRGRDRRERLKKRNLLPEAVVKNMLDVVER
jgi:hypothetical protein